MYLPRGVNARIRIGIRDPVSAGGDNANGAPIRLSISWADQAKADVRGIDRSTALQILYCVDRYLANRQGNVTPLTSPLTGLRLRCGDYRVFFKFASQHVVHVSRVLHRGEAYR